jgi:hypothetical protein
MTRPQPPLESDLDTDLRREFEHHLELLRRDELCRGAEESRGERWNGLAIPIGTPRRVGGLFLEVST